MGLWDKFVVPPLISCACATKPIMKQREKVVPKAKGRVLEIGCGSGTNFDFYDPLQIERLYALEPSEGMMKRAKAAAEDLPWADRIEFLEMGAENLPLDDASIDTAVIPFVLCTIPDWSSALAEVRRVERDGTFGVRFTELEWEARAALFVELAGVPPRVPRARILPDYAASVRRIAASSRARL